MRPIHYQTGRGTLCSLDNDASIRTPTGDNALAAVNCPYCRELIRLNAEARARVSGEYARSNPREAR